MSSACSADYSVRLVVFTCCIQLLVKLQKHHNILQVTQEGVAEMTLPVWLHMDVTDENIQVVLGTPAESMCHTEHSDGDGGLEDLRACYILDFGDIGLGKLLQVTTVWVMPVMSCNGSGYIYIAYVFFCCLLQVILFMS